MLFAVLFPAVSSAQPVPGNGYYYTSSPRNVYGGTVLIPDRQYPYAQTQDGYSGYPYAARPAQRSSVMASLPQDYESSSGYDNSIDYAIAPEFQRQVVAYNGRERPGTIIVDTPRKFLYLVQADGRAIRYGIGVGRPGFEWAGRKKVSMKREWPDWRPPAEMLRRRPDLPRYMEGGPDNPLGARALYLGSSLYRIHGTNEPHTIGQAVSSGCIRMLNQDVIDLYSRVRVGAPVIVI
jgi:lipoprotein-anchoring transpeptidase ErfK/SrfK